MATYSWEQNGAKQKKRVKATGTVVFNPNTHVSNSFEDCKELSAETKDALTSRLKFREFLPAQSQTFKGIWNGRDVILHSRTGSGKTLAYALPILERFLSEKAKLPEEEAAVQSALPAAPYMLIFVFGNELAFQTKSVIQSVYGDRVNVAVAGFDEVTQETPVDVLVGTLGTIDRLIRGRRGGKNAEDDAAASDDEAEDSSDDDDESSDESDAEEEVAPKPAQKKRERGAAAPPSRKAAKAHRAEAARNMGIVSLARVRSVVIDEVDVTMGPKFSTIGRRLKNLLKVVRRSNGSLNPGMASDVRMHHYVLCGATIPNWVIKAGFLGVKKYYYRLVTAGDAKVPSTLECFTYMCPKPRRISTTAELIVKGNLGRTVIFTTGPRVQLLETAIREALAKAGEAAASPAPKGKAKKAGKASSLPVLRVLAAEKDEMDRVACIEDFNSGAATVLLCTDAAARGLDFVAVETVLMESVPDYVGATDTFVHRAGRSARVENAGRCIMLADPTKDQQRIAQLESVLHIAFKEFPHLDSDASSSQTVRLSLRVAQGVKPALGRAAVKPPTPREAVESCVDAKRIVAIEETDRPDKVVLVVRTGDREAVRKALWKYDVKIL